MAPMAVADGRIGKQWVHAWDITGFLVVAVPTPR